MRRADRLLELLQTLRRLTPPVTAAALAQSLEVSVRTVYRDIEALRRLGVGIDGEAGFGYLLTEDHALPPLMFTGPEVEALALGLRKVMAIGDQELATAAENALTKLGPVLPKPVRRELESGILPIPAKAALPSSPEAAPCSGRSILRSSGKPRAKNAKCRSATVTSRRGIPNV